MTKTFFENFKRRFGEVTMIYFYDPIEKRRRYLNLESNGINFEKVDWEKDAMTITYIETISYIDWSGKNKCHKERKVQNIKRENIQKVLFRQSIEF